MLDGVFTRAGIVRLLTACRQAIAAGNFAP
jgi:hypothetical protein